MTEIKFSRHKTAISRIDFSRPIQLALDTGLIQPDWSVLDYGCGRGDDVKGLSARGIKCFGWDPEYSPNNHLHEADIVNLGYVVNVIEDLRERCGVLHNAWKYTRKALVVSARLLHESKGLELTPLGDGFVTSRSTFQKFFSQQELRNWIDRELTVASVAVSPGIFFVFKDDQLQQNFLASRYKRTIAAPSIRKSDILFEKYKNLLTALSIFVMERGRLPNFDEFEYSLELKEKLGSINRAYSVIRKVAGTEQWNKITEARTQDLLIHLALNRFLGKPKFSSLPRDIQLDIKSFFSSYARAWKQADDLLFSAGDLGKIDIACRSAPYGKLTHDALYVHICAIQLLPPILRVYEGCARNYVGVPDGANIIKLHRQKPKVSYLSYPDFDKAPHPTLHGALVVPLRDFDVKFWEWASSDNPPILHRKEEFVPKDYPHREKFESLTRQEEKAGLFSHPSTIGRLQQWNQLVLDKKLRFVGHRLIALKH